MREDVSPEILSNLKSRGDDEMENNPEEVSLEVLSNIKSTDEEEIPDIHPTLPSIPPILSDDDEYLNSEVESSKCNYSWSEIESDDSSPRKPPPPHVSYIMKKTRILRKNIIIL
jgi:hypothetical protein